MRNELLMLMMQEEVKRSERVIYDAHENAVKGEVMMTMSERDMKAVNLLDLLKLS
jgi:hypothetical protein